MNFSISKRILYNNLTIVSRAISGVAPVPSLSGVKIDVLVDELVLTGSDSNISIKANIKKNEENKLLIEEEGSIVIDAKYILEIVRKIDSDIVTFDTIDGTFTLIKGEKAEFKMNGMRAKDYPDIDFDMASEPFKMNTKIFTDIVKQTAFACSDKETRPALTGVNFKASGNELVCNATDSYRLATKKINLEEAQEFDFTISSKVLSEIATITANKEDFMMVIDNTKLFILSDNILVRTRLIEDAYPDTSRLIPPSFTQTLEINSKDLTDAIDRTSFIKSDGKNVVKMSINSETLEITSYNQEIGSSHEVLPVISFNGNPINISCSGKYLCDALKAIGKETVILSFSGELRPIIINAKDSNDLIQLISPVRTYN